MLYKVKEYVKQKLDNESTGHDYMHAKRVLKNAELLMDETMNQELIQVSCLVHDVIDPKVTRNLKKDKNELIKFLSALYSDEFIQTVMYIIDNISYSKGMVPETIEGRIVQDADRLDSLGAIGIARTFAFGGKNERTLYHPDKECTVDHFYDKLFKLTDLMNTSAGKLEAKRRTDFMKHFLDEFYKEVN